MDKLNQLREVVKQNKGNLGKYKEYLTLQREQLLETISETDDGVVSMEQKGRSRLLKEQIAELS